VKGKSKRFNGIVQFFDDVLRDYIVRFDDGELKPYFSKEIEKMIINNKHNQLIHSIDFDINKVKNKKCVTSVEKDETIVKIEEEAINIIMNMVELRKLLKITSTFIKEKETLIKNLCYFYDEFNVDAMTLIKNLCYFYDEFNVDAMTFLDREKDLFLEKTNTYINYDYNEMHSIEHLACDIIDSMVKLKALIALEKSKIVKKNGLNNDKFWLIKSEVVKKNLHTVYGLNIDDISFINNGDISLLFKLNNCIDDGKIIFHHDENKHDCQEMHAIEQLGSKIIKSMVALRKLLMSTSNFALKIVQIKKNLQNRLGLEMGYMEFLNSGKFANLKSVDEIENTSEIERLAVCIVNNMKTLCECISKIECNPLHVKKNLCARFGLKWEVMNFLDKGEISSLSKLNDSIDELVLFFYFFIFFITV
jgi:hypothetical protein